MVRTTELIEMQCGTCGVWHAIPKAMRDSCKEEGGYWHCPNGHQRGYREGLHEREALRRERDKLKQDAARLEQEREEALKEARAMKDKYLKVQKRAAAGVCPCCNRTFTNVQRHMKTKHPNVVPLEQKKV